MEETPTPRALEPPQPAAERTAGGGAGAAGPGAHGVTPEAPELWRPGPGQRTPHPAGVGEAARALGTTLGAPGPGTSLGLIYLRLPRSAFSSPRPTRLQGSLTPLPGRPQAPKPTLSRGSRMGHQKS
ncbi:translation initiation factor IF-2-like isoform X2 [Vulpes lagopus]|uniref:translation initiation factor IF-2-like isoform X2 n=1 Tax=Vulpes lagopus TaxID=494514 RepID=UPI001BC9BB8C|nr:translation initiation factor IF-2-like isoform X2 [Vulpes lagopus]